jgi:glycosyltransferase involved in cell wall biosynthesis
LSQISDYMGFMTVMPGKACPPLVSVIIPFLNAEKFLEEAILSVCMQTYDNWEILLVDDGSTDRSTCIAKEYARQYSSKIRYLEHERHGNRGTTVSRNLALSVARGSYVALLDSDDVWLPNKLERQVDVLDSQPASAMLCGSSEYWYSWTRTPEDRKRDVVHPLGLPPNEVCLPPRMLSLSLANKARTPCPSNILLRRDVIERIGGFEESFIGANQLYEDQAFLAKLCLSAPIFVVEECWDRYRQHPDSCDSLVEKAGLSGAARLFYLNWLLDYLTQHSITHPELWKVLHREVWRLQHPRLHASQKWARHHGSRCGLMLLSMMRRVLPSPIRRWIKAQWQNH